MRSADFAEYRRTSETRCDSIKYLPQGLRRSQHIRKCQTLLPTVPSALNHSYWIVGVTVGAVVVAVLGHAVDPERLRSWTNGMEFSMAALFLVIFTDQIRRKGEKVCQKPHSVRPNGEN